MPTDVNNTLDFGHGLNLTRAELALVRLASLTPKSKGITLNLSQIRHVEVGASWRLGNALRRASRIVPVTILLPPDFDLDNTQWYKWLTHTGLGLAFARYAATIRSDSQDVTQEVREYYDTPRAHRDQPVPAWSSPTLLLVPSLHEGIVPTENAPGFNALLRDLLLDSKLDVRAYSRDELDSLFRLLFEAVQNVWDHADRPPHPPDAPVLSYLAVRYFRKINPPNALTREFSRYLERQTQLPDSNYEHLGFIETVVVDDGAGIAARQSQQREICRGSFDQELRVLSTAFSKGGSVKLVVQDTTLRGTPGYGFAKITAALKSVQGFALIRTGRALAFYDGTQDQGSFEALNTPLGELPGTVLQIVLPRREAQLWSLPDAD